MASLAPAQQILTRDNAGAALAALSHATKEASRAHSARPAIIKTTQPVSVDFTSLSLENWRSKGAL
eukprot:2618322-Pleurochrysis_carterae.AAC.1